MKKYKPSIIIILFNLSLLFLLNCSNNQNDSVITFVEEYINTVSSEHAKFHINITEKMKNYYMDYENKEKADMPEFLEIGPFRNKILIINKFTVLSAKRIKDLKVSKCKYIYEINVLFDIKTENDNIEQKIVNYWVTSYQNKLYIYGDSFLQDIFILEKDIQNKKA